MEPVREENLFSQVLVTEKSAMSKRDFWVGIIAGLIIGVLIMPVLRVAEEDIYLKLKYALLPLFLIGTPLGLFAAHLISRKISVSWQLAKFGVTGVLNVLVDFGTLAILIFIFRYYFAIDAMDIFLSLGITISFYSLYKATSFVIANVNSYFWNKYWTFEKKDSGHSQFIGFFVVSVTGFFINVAIASLIFKNITPIGNMNYDQWALIGAALASIIGLAWNFLGYKFFVFKK